MQIVIDTRTVLLTSFALNFLLVLFIAAYQSKRKKEKNAKMFMGGKLFQTAAFAVWGLGSVIQMNGFNSWALFAGSVLLLIAIFFECLAVILLINASKKCPVKIYSIAIIAFSAIYIFAYFINTTQNFRIVLFSIFASALVIYPLLLLFKWKLESKMQQMAGAIYLMMMACLVFRFLVAGGMITNDTSLQGQIQSWILFLLFTFMILSNCGYYFLTKVRADIKLLQLANSDELTNILNRRAFNEVSEKTIRYCARKNEPVSFILFDVDNFKKINDTFGHYVGDMVLVEIASMVQSQIRAYDFFARYGGDEFALFLPSASGPEAEAVAQRLLKSVESKNIYNHTKLRATISLGLVTVVPSSDTSMEALYQLGDGALYDAKQAGGNCMMPPVQTAVAGECNGKTD